MIRPAVVAPIALLCLIIGPAVAMSSPEGSTDDDWRSWRGPNRDGICPTKGLVDSWPESGPPLAWKATGLGKGYSSVCVFDGRVYTLGDEGRDSFLICLEEATGKELWRTRTNAAGTHRQYPGPRSTPATDGEIVVGLGETGDLVVCDAKSGKIIWQKHMERDLGGRMMSRWKWSESPLIDGDLVLVTPCGGSGAIVALSKKDGSIVWRSKEVSGNRAAYTSLVPLEIGGKRQYMVLTDRTVAGVDAEDGSALWQATRRGATAVAATPIYQDGYVFTTSGYRVGCNGFKLTEEGGKFSAQEVYRGRQMANHHGGCVAVGGYIYGVDDGGSIKCIDIKTGEEKWAGPRVGKGSVAYADGHIVYRSENGRRGGTIRLVEATPDAYRETGKFNPPNRSGDACWAHPAISDGKLYLRDHDVLLVYDLRSGAKAGSGEAEKPAEKTPPKKGGRKIY